MRKLLPLFFALLLPLVACSGEDDPIAPNKVGSLSFSYSGDISGTFSVSGEANIDDNDYPQNAFAVAQAEGGEVSIAGIRPTQRPKFDFFGIELADVAAPRTIQVCALPTGGACPVIFFLLGANSDTEAVDQAYVFTSGSVVISGISAERVRGSFSGTAVLLNLATGQPNLARTITVTNGQFDVPVRNDLED